MAAGPREPAGLRLFTAGLPEPAGQVLRQAWGLSAKGLESLSPGAKLAFLNPEVLVFAHLVYLYFSLVKIHFVS